MTTSAVLLQLLTVQAQIDAYTAQSIRINNQYDANHEKLAEYQKYEETYNDKYDKLYNCDYESSDKTFKAGNYNETGYSTVTLKKDGKYSDTELADWANGYALSYIKDDNFSEILYDLEDIDIELDTMKTLIETQLETLKAQKEKLQSELAAEAQDTHQIGQ